MTAHYVYRCYDDDARLLYVGSSKDTPSRFAQHRVKSFWSKRVVQVRVLVYRDKETALAHERTAIRNEAPLFNNVKHCARDRWTQRDYRDYIDFLMAERDAYTYGAGQIKNLFRAYHLTFGECHLGEAMFMERSARELRIKQERDERERAEDARRSDDLERREAEDARLHVAECCACRYGVVIDDALVAEYGNTGARPGILR